MTFSIIVPTLNRCDALARTLHSIASLNDSNVEVLVVDNGSTDATRASFDAACPTHAKQAWRFLVESVPGLLSGRHRGALEAQGEICLFVDDDIRVTPRWLGAFREVFADPAIVLAGGPSRPLFAADPPPWLDVFYDENEVGRFCAWLSLFDGGTRLKAIPPDFVWGLNYAIRRKTLFDLGGFHPDCIPKSLQRFQGDGETGLSQKIHAAGLKAVYHPEAAVEHEILAPRLTAEYFAQRAYYQGVCDSYTEIRARGYATERRSSWKDPLRRLKSLLKDSLRTDRSLAQAIQNQTRQAYAAGYDFHRTEVLGDPKLLEWVLRPDYWDYRLPED